MTTVIVVDAYGKETSLQVNDGITLMEALRPLGIGIQGECEGSLACASCHVWVDPSWIERLPEVSEDEAEMLDCAFHVRSSSRLSCQILVSDAIDGLRVQVASA